MKMFLFTITALLFSAPQVFAHEEGMEVTNLAEADWIGPLIAVIVVVGAVIIARAIRARSNANKQIISNNQKQNL
ncbi:MAG: hypothetical protein HYS74_02200 [Parcubacteria group bacterium]|nr:hypothetical protein [Parcubacteria group bacterium]